MEINEIIKIALNSKEPVKLLWGENQGLVILSEDEAARFLRSKKWIVSPPKKRIYTNPPTGTL